MENIARTGALELRGIEKRFGSFSALERIDLAFEPGEFVVIVGPSGCGKSTLLRLIAGLETASGGRIVLSGRDVTDLPAARRGLAMVFQSYALYPHKTVAQNMGFALKIAGRKRAEIDAQVRETARVLQLEPLLDRYPRELSGGQRQRVAIGRCIVRHPELFLFDEPLSNLDAALRAEMRVELGQLHKRLGSTMIYVTHDQIEAMTLADRIVVLKDGRIQQVGTPKQLYARPANLFVATFIGSPKMNLIEGRISQDGSAFEGPAFRLPLPRRLEPAQATLGLRPEHLDLDTGNGPSYRVEMVEYLGDESVVYGRLRDGLAVTARCSGEARVKAGDETTLSLDATTAHLFDAKGRLMETA